MGAFYNSICIPGDERLRARDSLLRWLGGRGFELSDQPVLFDLDDAVERCAFVVSNPCWTLVFFSHYEEERRLIRELQNWSLSLLYVWVQDSDVWGYDVFDSAGFAGSFNCDPRTYRSFDDGDEDDTRPATDVEAFCRRFGLAGSGAKLRAIHRRRAVFKEDVCREFCRLIGAEPALTTYDDLERGAFEATADWRVERMLFVHRDAAIEQERRLDLHQVELRGLGERVGADEPASELEIPPEVLAEMARRRPRTRLTLRLLRPLSWLARSWRLTLEAPALLRRAASGRAASGRAASGRAASGRAASGRASGHSMPGAARVSGPEPSGAIEVRHLINERHRCRIRLAPGGEAKPGSSKPASVFAFQIGPTAVSCVARRRSGIEEALQRPDRAKVLRDEKYLIGGLPARHVVFQLPPYYLAGAPGPSYLGLHVVQTEWAHYVFLYRFPREILRDVEWAIRVTVASFRLLG